METGPRLKVSSDRLLKPGIEPATPGLQGKRFIHYTTAAPRIEDSSSLFNYKRMEQLMFDEILNRVGSRIQKSETNT